MHGCFFLHAPLPSHISLEENETTAFSFLPRVRKREEKKRELTQVHFPAAAAAAAAAAGCFQGPLSPTTSSSSSSFSLPFTPERAAHTHPPRGDRGRMEGRGREKGDMYARLNPCHASQPLLGG